MSGLYGGQHMKKEVMYVITPFVGILGQSSGHLTELSVDPTTRGFDHIFAMLHETGSIGPLPLCHQARGGMNFGMEF